MFKKLLSVPMVLVMGVFILGCNKNNIQVETYVDPQFSNTPIKTVAVFPFENARFTPAQSLEINKKVSMAVYKLNRNVEIISPATVMAKVGDNGLVEKWAWFIRDYDTSGIPNTKTLHEIGTALGADVIVQGRLTGITQNDAHQSFFGGTAGQTKATITYAMFNTQGTDARLLWSSSCTAEKVNMTATPALYKVLNMGIDKVLKTMPAMPAGK